MNDDAPRKAPDLTQACLVMFAINLVWILVAVWALWGLVAAVFLGLGVNQLISYTQVWSAQRRAAAIRRGKS